MSVETVPSHKLVVLGDSSVGKTSLIHRFINNEFNPNSINTIGAAYITKDYNSVKDPSKKIKFEIWDTAGQERYRSLTPMYYRSAKTALVCFDLSDSEDTFKKAQFWIEQLELNSNEQDMKIIVVGNKLDLVDDTHGQRYRESINRPLEIFFASAKTGEGVQDIFESIINSIDDSFFEDFRRQEQERSDRGGDGSINIFGARLSNTKVNRSCC